MTYVALMLVNWPTKSVGPHPQDRHTYWEAGSMNWASSSSFTSSVTMGTP